MKPRRVLRYLPMVCCSFPASESYGWTALPRLISTAKTMTAIATFAAAQPFIPLSSISTEINLPANADLLRTSGAETSKTVPIPEGALRAPTEEKPQIMIPEGFLKPAAKDPIMQGLVYLRDDDAMRPLLGEGDFLVLTAGRASSPDIVLAGAKIPALTVRFPMQFSMFKENVMRGKAEEWAAAKDDDLIITAKICPASSTALPCEDGESAFRARGISKVIKNLPGMREGDSVRTAASLVLR